MKGLPEHGMFVPVSYLQDKLSNSIFQLPENALSFPIQVVHSADLHRRTEISRPWSRDELSCCREMSHRIPSSLYLSDVLEVACLYTG